MGVAVVDGVIGIGVKTGIVPVEIGVQVYGSKVAVIKGMVFVAVGARVMVGVA